MRLLAQRNQLCSRDYCGCWVPDLGQCCPARQALGHRKWAHTPGKPLPVLDQGRLALWPLHVCIWVFLPLSFLLCNQGQPAPLKDKRAPHGMLRSLLCRHCQTCSPLHGMRKRGPSSNSRNVPTLTDSLEDAPGVCLESCQMAASEGLSCTSLPLCGLCLKVWQQPLIPPEPAQVLQVKELCRLVRF